MKKFIAKSSFFVIPFFALYIINVIFYKQTQGDLARLGYFYSNPLPKDEIKNLYSLSKKYSQLSELDLNKKSNFDVIIFGDSFSGQDSLGYKNFIAHKGLSVLHIDEFIPDENPLQTLIQFNNSGLFNKIKPKYIILQSIERVFIDRCQNLEYNKKANIDSLIQTVKYKKKKTSNNELDFFSEGTLKIPLTNIQYLFVNRPEFSETFLFKSKKMDLFTNNPGNLLFYINDINNLSRKNDSIKILKSIEVLNKINFLLSEQSINLIVLISPDKYDLYYKYIYDHSNLKKPSFFSIYRNFDKEYIDIDSYKILSENIKKSKDIYYYDDSHWSPKGASIIADELYNVISKSNN